MANLFDKAKKKGSVEPKGAAKEEIVIVDPVFHANLSRLATVNQEMDDLKAEATVLAGIVKDKAKDEFCKLYEKKHKYPGSFMIKAEGMKNKPAASFMFIPTDKYIKIGKERFEELTELYDSNLVTEKTVYTMDADLIEKYGDIIGDLIEKCKLIPEEDKEKLISASVAYEIKKGTISELPYSVTRGKKTTTYPIEQMVAEINPIFQTKNVKINK